MEAMVTMDEEAPLAMEFNKRGRKYMTAKRKTTNSKTLKNEGPSAAPSEVRVATEGGVAVEFADYLPIGSENRDDSNSGIEVLVFDDSVDNYFRAVDTISRLCGESGIDDSETPEIERLSSSILFLREWVYFNYEPRIVRFACQNEDPHGKDVIGGINLPQFSSASVPKDRLNGSAISSHSGKDFIMHVGGSVWALDWCPRAHRSGHIKSEFIAVAAHSPDSLYHKNGAPLTGKGIIQIWCLLNVSTEDELLPSGVNKKAKRNSKKTGPTNAESSQPKKPRGRPRKNPVKESKNSVESSNLSAQALTIQYPEDSSSCMLSGNANELADSGDTGRQSKVALQVPEYDADTLASTSRGSKKNMRKKRNVDVNNVLLPALGENEDTFLLKPQTSSSCVPPPVASIVSIQDTDSSESSQGGCSISMDVALPRLVLCLAHNGKVAWDVKWRPCSVYYRLTMGYLAVLLGNGTLEVWEVPLPHTMKVIYPAHQSEGTDPRFVKLEPVFRGSKLKFGDRQSIPLTMEWSPSSPHDLILVGYHDGVVAMWKFSAETSKETRPLVCFSADTVPISGLAWAPFEESGSECSNVIVTAGHKGVKFWDIRDPFRPLWDLNPVQKIICSLDWLTDPRCLIISFDDGTLRILSLVKAAYDVPVTGKPFVGTQQQGLHSYYCSSSSIWSVQVSRSTGMVAYCSADGTVLRFQLTMRSVERDPFRNREPHYLCGSLVEEDSALIVITPLPNVPFPMKRSVNEWGEAPRTIRGFLSVSNQQKRAKEQMEKALCYDDDPGVEYGSDATMMTQKNEIVPKTKVSNKKKRKHAEGLESKDAETENMQENRNSGAEIEVFPSKIVAMHRVRWNMNKGSGRWLCYGGAGGIVRCQEINLS